MSALLETTRGRRRRDQRELIEILWHSGHLHPDVDIDTAADLLYGLMNEEVFQLLIRDCGWSVEQFRSWATSLLLQQLVGATGARP